MRPADVEPTSSLSQGLPSGVPPSKHRRGRRLAGALLVTAVLALSSLLVWHKWIKREFFPNNFGVVKEGAIYRSAQHSPRVLRNLCKEHRIRTILDLGGARGDHDARTNAQRAVAAELGIERIEFLLPSDGRGDPDKYVEALLLMSDPARQPVLVHCGSGAQRTSTVVTLYRTIVEGETVTKAYPESFDFGHKPKSWVLLAYIADKLPYIRRAFNQRSISPRW